MVRVQGPFLALFLATFAAIAGAQNAPSSPRPSTPQEPAPQPLEVLHAGTELVIVDVVVQDRNGNPVHGLTRDNFLVEEQKKPQVIRHFEEHSASVAAPAGVALPPLPPGNFTDYTPVSPDGTLNVLLIDTLNTPMKDQMFVRQQLLDYIKHEKPGTQIAIFGLSSRLYMLQGFTADPGVLKAAVQHRLLSRASPLLEDPTGDDPDPETLSDLASEAGLTEAASNMQDFEAQEQAFQTQLRVQYTIDAFDAMGHYLSNFPGRKNLIWFSGSFPINILPDPTLNDPFSVMEINDQEFRDMTNLLARSQVAVYPIDARGLMTAPMWDASRSGRNYVTNPSAFGNDLAKFNQSQGEEHMTMEEMASDTGGHAFYNTNGLANAVAKALNDGANYYTIAYTPTDHNWNGAYRNIKVELMGPPAAQQLRLSYRHGYYADDPEHSGKHAQPATTALVSDADSAHQAAQVYSRAAMSRGAPAPSDILFKVRVLPISTTVQNTLAPDNNANPDGLLKPPYRQYGIDFAMLGNNFSLTLQPATGRYSGALDVNVLVYDADGTLLNAIGKTVQLNLTPDVYKRFISGGVGFHLEVSAPAKQESFLRVVVHDIPSNRYGVVEIPSTEISRLAPLPQPAAPASAPSKAAPPAASTAPQSGIKQ